MKSFRVCEAERIGRKNAESVRERRNQYDRQLKRQREIFTKRKEQRTNGIIPLALPLFHYGHRHVQLGVSLPTQYNKSQQLQFNLRKNPKGNFFSYNFPYQRIVDS